MQSSLPQISKMNEVSEAGFPDIMCPVVFLSRCNFKCPYCLNTELVSPKEIKSIPISEVLQYVKDNREEHILISGGEPCLHNNICNLVDVFRNSGLRVRLSTNGSFPHTLQKLIFHHSLSFIAMDIKTER